MSCTTPGPLLATSVGTPDGTRRTALPIGPEVPDIRSSRKVKRPVRLSTGAYMLLPYSHRTPRIRQPRRLLHFSRRSRRRYRPRIKGLKRAQGKTPVFVYAW